MDELQEQQQPNRRETEEKIVTDFCDRLQRFFDHLRDTRVISPEVHKDVSGHSFKELAD